MTRTALEGPSVGTKAEGRSALKSSPGMNEGEAGGGAPSLVDQEGVREGIVRLAVARTEKIKDPDPIRQAIERTNIVVDTVQALAVMSPRIERRNE